MRLLVTGAQGQLGAELVQLAADTELDFVGYGRAQLDLTNWKSVSAAVKDFDVVINCAAHTRVDAAEGKEGEQAFLSNAVGVKNLAAACAHADVRLIHLSTDYVFNGKSSVPYVETDATNPQSVYGQSKLDGERSALDAHPYGAFIVRTSWVYGAYGPNFVRTMLKLAESRETVSVVNDQVGQPTWTRDLAAGLLALARSEAAPGIYHFSGEGACSWFEFAQAIFEYSGLDPARVLPTTSSEFVRPAPRPAFSVMSHEKWLAAGLPAPMDWRDALRAFLGT